MRSFASIVTLALLATCECEWDCRPDLDANG